ncbi:LOW QUALITY PROTEIN: hypothetical protein Nmel_011695 [Mimus melanotis]
MAWEEEGGIDAYNLDLWKMEQPGPRTELPGSLPAIRIITKAITGSRSQFSSKEVQLWVIVLNKKKKKQNLTSVICCGGTGPSQRQPPSSSRLPAARGARVYLCWWERLHQCEKAMDRGEPPNASVTPPERSELGRGRRKPLRKFRKSHWALPRAHRKPVSHKCAVPAGPAAPCPFLAYFGDLLVFKAPVLPGAASLLALPFTQRRVSRTQEKALPISIPTRGREFRGPSPASYRLGAGGWRQHRGGAGAGPGQQRGRGRSGAGTAAGPGPRWDRGCPALRPLHDRRSPPVTGRRL